MKNINIDLRQSSGNGGISNYIRNISSLLEDGSLYRFRGCTFWYRHRDDSQFHWFPGKLCKSFLPERIAFNKDIPIRLSYENLMNSKADLNVFFSYRLPNVVFKAPIVSTIHDIILLKTQCEPKHIIDEHQNILKQTIRKSSYILTVSEASKNDLVEYFHIDPKLVFVVHNGINQQQFSNKLSKERVNELRKKYNLPKLFILNFGAYRKHKNIERLLDAYSRLHPKIRKEYKLVLTKSHPILIQKINQLSIQEDVRFIGFVSEEDKPSIFKMASVVYYASLYEGFGVPVIEAQAAGVPVITSTTSSLPEAAGNGAVMVNPYCVEDITEAIEHIIEDRQYADMLIKNGVENSKQYTWERSVNEFYRFLSAINI